MTFKEAYRAGLPIGVNGNILQPSFADMSAQQRSKSMDNIVKQVATLTASNNALVEQLREHRAMLDAHAGVVLRPTLLGRLRWLVMGV